jgi:hypothetical protein
LLAENKVLLNAVLSAIKSTDADKMTKSLVFLFEKHSKGFELLTHSISREVSHAGIYLQEKVITHTGAENLLFRGDSLATKMFNVYAKTVALYYIHEVLSPHLIEEPQRGSVEEVVGDRVSLRSLEVKDSMSQSYLDFRLTLPK